MYHGVKMWITGVDREFGGIEADDVWGNGFGKRVITS